MKNVQSVLMLTFVLFSTKAYALDFDFYTYGGFSETVLAFQRISLFFNHSNFMPMVFIAAVFGFMLGGSFFFTRQLIGDNAGSPVRFMMIPAIGIIIYQALIIPRGTVHIYDETMNAYQAVGNVPDLVILLAGGWNKLERMTAEIEGESSAYPYEKQAGGISFQLLFGVALTGRDMSQHYLSKSIKTLYKDCSEIPLSVASSGFDLQSLRSGTTDIVASLDNIAWSSSFTTYYDIDNKAGLTLSCAEAWTTRIKPLLNDPSIYDGAIQNICSQAGFNPAAAVQLSRCKELMGSLGMDYLGHNVSHIPLLKMAYVSSLISEAMAEDNPDIAVKVMTNRDMITDGIGAAINSQEWVSTFRSVMLTVVLGMFPILTVFLATQFAFKALFLMSGLFAWAAMWGVIDIVANGIAIDQAIGVMDEIRVHQLGLDAWFNAPTGAMKAVAIFGKIRGYGATIASIVVAGVFGFSAYSLSSMADSWQRTTEKSGSEAADKAVNPEQRGQQYESMVRGQSTESTVARTGFESMAHAASYRQGSETYGTLTESQMLQGSGMNLGGSMAASGAVRGGESAGGVLSVMKMSGTSAPHGFTPGEAGADPMASTSASAAFTQKSMSLASNEGIIKAARDTGVSPTQMAWATTYMSQLQSVNDGELLASMAPRDILSGYYGNALSSMHGGKIMDNVASNYEGGKTQFFDDLSNSRFGADFARFSTTSMLAEKLDDDIFSTAVQMNSSGFSLIVTPDNINALDNAGLVSSNAYATLAKDNYNGRLDFSFDPNRGVAVDVSASSGTRATSNNSTSYLATDLIDESSTIRTGILHDDSMVTDNRVVNDNSHSDNSSVSVQKGYRFDNAFDVGSYSVNQLALDPNNRADLAEMLDKSFDSKANGLQFDNSAATMLSTIVSKRAGDHSSEQSSESFNRGVGASAEAGAGIKGAGPLSASAGINGNMSYQWSDSESHGSSYSVDYQVALAELQSLRMNADTKAQELAQFSMDHDAQVRNVYGQAPYSEDERTEKYEEYVSKYRADAYAIAFEEKVNESLNNLQNASVTELQEGTNERAIERADKAR